MWLGRNRAGALVFCFAALVSSAQSVKFCEGELGTAPWVCEGVSPVNPDVYSDAWLPVPNAAPGNPVTYEQIAGKPAFDDATGERNSNAAVFALTDGSYQCMLAESNGEAALFDAPEGEFPAFSPRSWHVPEAKAIRTAADA